MLKLQFKSAAMVAIVGAPIAAAGCKQRLIGHPYHWAIIAAVVA